MKTITKNNVGQYRDFSLVASFIGPVADSQTYSPIWRASHDYSKPMVGQIAKGKYGGGYVLVHVEEVAEVISPTPSGPYRQWFLRGPVIFGTCSLPPQEVIETALGPLEQFSRRHGLDY